jgi:hypothetical protein
MILGRREESVGRNGRTFLLKLKRREMKEFVEPTTTTGRVIYISI